jgi:chemotaxis signal transduction protein
MHERGVTVGSSAATAAQLRAEFDAAFAAEPVQQVAQPTAIVLVRIADDWRVALRTAQLGGLHACPPLLRLPGGRGSQLGIVGLRGSLVVAHGLGQALGSAAPQRGGWLALCGADRALGFVFEALDGYFTIAHEHLHAAGADADCDDGTAGATGWIRLDSGAYPLIDLDQLLARVRAGLTLETSEKGSSL